jgi:hypothetical protein
MADNRFRSYIDAATAADVTFDAARGMVADYRQAHMRTETFDFRVHKYQINERVAVSDMHRIPPEEMKRMVKRKMAESIGAMIMDRVAVFESQEDHLRREIQFRAEFYAIPPQVVNRMNGDTMRYAVPTASIDMETGLRQPVQAPREVVHKYKHEHNIPEIASDKIVEIYQNAYDVALMNEDDDCAPEKRGLTAVFEYMKANPPS